MSSDADPYLIPGTSTLRNKLGITDADTLRAVEAAYAKARLLHLRVDPSVIATSFDRHHLQAIHWFVFQDLYDWAGELRTRGIRKNDCEFAPPGVLTRNLDRMAETLARDNGLRGLGHSEFCRQAAQFWGDLNYLHPFREGNGRTSLEFMRQVADAAGYRFDYLQIQKEELGSAARENILTWKQEGLRDLFMKHTTELHHHHSQDEAAQRKAWSVTADGHGRAHEQAPTARLNETHRSEERRAMPHTRARQASEQQAQQQQQASKDQGKDRDRGK